PQRPSHIPEKLFAQWNNFGRVVFIELWCFVREARLDRADLGRSLIHADAILQPRHDAKKPPALICTASRRHRQDGPELCGSARARTLFDVKLKTRRHHADDRKSLTVESDLLPNGTCLPAKATLPQPITKHCDRIIIRQKRSTEKRLDT